MVEEISSSNLIVQKYLNNTQNSVINYPQTQINQQPQADTVELSTKQKIKNKVSNLSATQKFGIGSCLVLGLGALAYVLTRGRTCSSSVKQLAEHIDFKEAKTMDEATAFAKEQLGVKLKIGNNLQVANFINEQLVQVSNYMKGQSIMPKIVKYSKNIKSAEGLKSYASWQDNTQTMNISQDMVEVLNALSEKYNGNILKYLKQLAFDKTIEKNLRECAFEQLMVIPHELGHANHFAQCSLAKKGLMDTLGNMKLNNIKDTTITKEFLEEVQNSPLLRKELREQAQTAPIEFVADKFAWNVLGKNSIKEIDDLYIKYHGPICI